MIKKNMVNMVHPQQIVEKKLKGCNTTRTVTTFAQKNGVPYVWWKPTANQKVMLVDWTQFRQAWNKAGTNYGIKTTPTKNYGPKTTGSLTNYPIPANKNYFGKVNGKATTITGQTRNRARINSTRGGNNTAHKTYNKTNYKMNIIRRRNAA